jgi:hypothetical protein
MPCGCCRVNALVGSKRGLDPAFPGLDRSDGSSDPIVEGLTIESASRHAENYPLGFINRTFKLVVVELQEGFQSCMPDPLLAVDEWMVLDERKGECCRLGVYVRVEILTAEAHPRLSNCGFESPQIPKSGPPTGELEQALMQHQHLAQGEIAH